MNDIIVLENFIDADTCDAMMKLYDREFQNKKPFVDGRKVFRNPQQPEVIAFLKTYLPKLQEALNGKYYLRDVFLSLYEKGAYLPAHIDYPDEKLKDSLGALFYFNEDFTGGELYFTNLNKSYKPRKGLVLVFPCNQELFQHGVLKILDGTRYTMPIELTLNEELKVYDI